MKNLLEALSRVESVDAALEEVAEPLIRRLLAHLNSSIDLKNAGIKFPHAMDGSMLRDVLKVVSDHAVKGK